MTSDIDRRLNQHNAGMHFYTKRYLPWAVVHQEQYDTLIDARAREKYFKSAAGRRFLKEMIFKS